MDVNITFQPECVSFGIFEKLGIKVSFQKTVGLIELMNYQSLSENLISELIKPDGTNLIEWPNGAEKDITPQMLEFCAMIYVFQYPTPILSWKDILFLFLEHSIEMSAVISYFSAVLEEVAPLVTKQLSKTTLAVSEDKPQKKTRSSSKSSGRSMKDLLAIAE